MVDQGVRMALLTAVSGGLYMNDEFRLLILDEHGVIGNLKHLAAPISPESNLRFLKDHPAVKEALSKQYRQWMAQVLAEPYGFYYVYPLAVPDLELSEQSAPPLKDLHTIRKREIETYRSNSLEKFRAYISAQNW